jgi:hypothetical protein
MLKRLLRRLKGSRPRKLGMFRSKLETVSKVSQKRRRGRPSKQKEPQEPSATVIEPIKKMVSVQPKSRNGLMIRKPAHFDGM